MNTKVCPACFRSFSAQYDVCPYCGNAEKSVAPAARPKEKAQKGRIGRMIGNVLAILAAIAVVAYLCFLYLGTFRLPWRAAEMDWSDWQAGTNAGVDVAEYEVQYEKRYQLQVQSSTANSTESSIPQENWSVWGPIESLPTTGQYQVEVKESADTKDSAQKLDTGVGIVLYGSRNVEYRWKIVADTTIQPIWESVTSSWVTLEQLASCLPDDATAVKITTQMFYRVRKKQL